MTLAHTDSAQRLRKLPPPSLVQAGLIPTKRKPKGIAAEAMFFCESRVCDLILKYRKTGELETWHKIIEESMNLIDALILDGRFDRYDCLDALRSECVIKLTYTISKWDPKRGKCFSLFSHSLKNFLYSYAARVKRYQSFMAATDSEIIENTADESRAASHLDFMARAQSIEVRFWRENHLAALSWLTSHFFNFGSDDQERRMILGLLVRRYGVSSRQAELLYSYALIKVRAALYDCYRQEFSEDEVFSSQYRWSLLPELYDMIGSGAYYRMLTVLAGQTIQFPSAVEIRRAQALGGQLGGLEDVSDPCMAALGIGSEAYQGIGETSLNGVRHPLPQTVVMTDVAEG